MAIHRGPTDEGLTGLGLVVIVVGIIALGLLLLRRAT